MALDLIPNFLSTPGVRHDSAILRVANYQATNGNSGVGGPSHLRVTAQGTPNGTVRVAPGTAAAVSRYPGVIGESYMARNLSSTNVAIAPTTSGGGRTDALILRIDDIGMVGQVPPAADLQTYEYVKLQVIQGVSSSLQYPSQLTLNYPFVLLARINIPASTGVITNAMITDLREVANPKERTVVRTHAQISAADVQTLTATAAYPTGQYLPQLGGSGNTSVHTMRVPEWATQAEIRGDWVAMAVDQSIGNGYMWIAFDDVIQNNPKYRTQTYKWSSEDTTQRQNWVVVDTVAIPSAIRGKDVHFSFRARRENATTSGYVRMDQASGISLSVRFLEAAD